MSIDGGERKWPDAAHSDLFSKPSMMMDCQGGLRAREQDRPEGAALKQFSPDLNLRDSQTVSDDGDSVH